MAAKRTWHMEQIKAELRVRHGSLSALSQAWGRNSACVSHALRRHGYSTEIERRIAQELDVSPHELWPERWTPRGRPVPASQTSERKTSRSQPLTHRQIEKAA